MMRKIFHNDSQQKTFHEDGIFSIPFIDSDVVQALSSVYHSRFDKATDRKFHSTMFINDVTYRREADKAIRDIIADKIEELLIDYRLLFSNFIVKETSPASAVGIHQDWNFTTPEFTSLNIWIPLTDITESTGRFYAMKGSQRTFQNIKYTPYPDNAYTAISDHIIKKSTPLLPKAGEALVYDGAMVHFSEPNRSGNLRIAIGIALIPKEAPCLHYYKKDSSKKLLDIYETDETFYTQFDFMQEPRGARKVGEITEYKEIPTLKELKNAEIKRRIFTNDALEQEITERGYCVIKDFSTQSTCEELSAFYNTYNSVDERKFTISNWSTDGSYRQKSYDFIKEKLLPLSQKYLDNYRSIMGVYTAKRPGSDSQMLLHQDWSLIDESKARSVSVWVALCDMDKENGNLQIALKSHTYAAYPRGMNVPIPFDEIRNEMLQNYMTDVPIKKGDAIVFDHRLIHASPPNNSDSIRLAAVLALIPEETPLIHHYYDAQKPEQLEILAMNEDDFRMIDFFDSSGKPKHISNLGTVSYIFEKISITEVKDVS